MDNTHILVVDDEADIRDLLEEYLSGQGFSVSTAVDARTARALVAQQPPDIALLDINMPREDGLSLARFLREHHDIGIIMVSAAGTTVDRIVGLELGADDYVSKPFDPRELLARVKSVIRRYHRDREATAAPTDVVTADRLHFAGYTLDLAARQLRDHGQTEISLTSMEFDLLVIFAQRPNRVLSRDQLLNLTQHRDWDPFDRSIDIRIARLRRKIEPDSNKPSIIRTIRSAGYMFCADPES